MPPSSTTSVLKPSDAPYTAADRPAGPAPTITRSKSIRSGSTGEPDACRDLGVGGVVQHRAVGEDDERQLAAPPAAATSARPSSESARRERVRDRAAPERLPQLVGPAGPGLADDVDGVRRRALRLGPVEQQARDRLVEQLVGGRRRPQHVVVDATLGDRVEDRLAGVRIAPVAPPDQQPALRVRVQPARFVQQLAAGRPVEPMGREHQRDVVAVVGELLHPGARRRRASDSTRRGSGGRSARAALVRDPAALPGRPRPRSAQELTRRKIYRGSTGRLCDGLPPTRHVERPGPKPGPRIRLRCHVS